MNSEQLGHLLGELLRGQGYAAEVPVVVRRAGPTRDADLLATGVAVLPVGLRARVVETLGERPEVSWAVLEGPVLEVRLTDAARMRALREAPAAVPAVDLRAPDRPVVLSGLLASTTPAAAAEVVGVDAVAYELARAHRRGVGVAPLRLDAHGVVRRTAVAPLFRVQWTHARAAAFTVRAAALRVPALGENVAPWGRDEPAGRLASSLVELPVTVARAARRGELAPVPRHLEEVADLLLGLDVEQRFLPADGEPVTQVHSGGLLLVATAQQLTARVLGMLGVGAPTRI